MAAALRVLFAGILWLAAAKAQEHASDPAPAMPAGHPKQGQQPPAVHTPHPELAPADALAWIRLAHERAGRARAAGTPVAPAPRPGGAGRHVVAVLVCAETATDIPALLGLAPADVLLISTPGAFVGTEAVAELERAVADERLSLCLVLTHPGCRSLRASPATTPSQAAVARRAEPARGLAARRGIDLAQAQALLQQQALLSASELLQAKVATGAFCVVPAQVDPKARAITWHTTRADELAIPVVR